MKKLLLIFMMGFMYQSLIAQNDVITQYFEKYYDDPNFTKVSVTSRMFELFTEIEPGDENEKEILDAISKLKGLKVLAADSAGNSRELFNNAVKKIMNNGYDELMQVKDAEEDMEFLIKEKDGIINELVMVVGGNTKFFILSLYGEIDLKSISKLSKSMSITGMNYLEKLDDGNSNKSDKKEKKEEEIKGS